MREIEFRGKRIDSNSWVYRYLFKTKKSNPDHKPTYWILNESGKYKEIPESVGQYYWNINEK